MSEFDDIANDIAEQVASSFVSEIDRFKAENEKLKIENEILISAYNNKPVTERKAMKVVLELLFNLLKEDGRANFKNIHVDEVIEQIHDDDYWFDDLVKCLDEHLDSFWENYGIEWDE